MKGVSGDGNFSMSDVLKAIKIYNTVFFRYAAFSKGS